MYSHDGLKQVKHAKVLVVDDTEFSRNVIKGIFNSYGFSNVESAADGLEALEKTESYNPDIVILDLLMPKLDGFGYCKAVRENPKRKQLPILVQSAVTNPQQVAEAFKSGATDFINKPINADEVIARSVVHLMNRRLVEDLRKYRQRTETELYAAKDMQSWILPHEEDIEALAKNYHVNVAVHFEPSSELGGDFWGMKPISDDKFCMYTVDFSGHGVTAALNTFRLHTIMENHQQYFHQPDMFLFWLNDLFSDLLQTGQYATIFYGVADIKSNTLSYVAAGVPSFILIREDGAVDIMSGKGIPLGVKKGSEYVTSTCDFNPGDLLVLYSDALIETADSQNIFFSEEQISKVLLENKEEPTVKKLRRLIKEFRLHSSGALEDDLTVNLYERQR